MLGIDLSLTDTGLALREVREDTRPPKLKLDRCRTTADNRLIDRQMQIFATINGLIKSIEEPCKYLHVFLEGYSFASKRGQNSHAIPETAGMLLYHCRINNYGVTRITPGALKKFGAGSGTATKGEMISAAYSDCFGDLQNGLVNPQHDTEELDKLLFNDNIADAYWLASYGLKLLQGTRLEHNVVVPIVGV